MRISDWSSDVCSSDLRSIGRAPDRRRQSSRGMCGAHVGPVIARLMLAIERCARGADDGVDHRIEKARGVLLPRFLVGIDQAEVLEAKVSAVGDFVTIVVVQADSCAGIARQAEDRKSTRLNS